MEENEKEVLDSTNETEETVETVEKEETPQVDVGVLEKEIATLKAQKEHWKQKAEKKAEAPVEKTDGLSQKDVIYLAKADIHEDDADDVVNYAQKMGVSVKEAHEHYKPILAERAEERKTAQATQTKGGTRGTTQPTPEALLEKARKGEVSEDDIDKLVEAKRIKEREHLK